MFGRNVIAGTGRDVQVIADIDDVDWKTGGITLDWNTIVAAAADAVLADDTPIKLGQKFLRFGQILCRIVNPALDIVTINGGPTGGTFTITVTRNGAGVTTSALAYNAAAATVQAAIQALSNVGSGNAAVTGSAGGPFTITFNDSLGAVTVTASGASLTGGTSPTATVAQSAPGGDLGYYGPYDPAALDGRQLLTRGECFILNRTVLQLNPITINVHNADSPPVFEGGRAWKARILMTTGTHSLAAGPTVAEFEAAFPRIVYVQNK
jgi:hypothetical protein